MSIKKEINKISRLYNSGMQGLMIYMRALELSKKMRIKGQLSFIETLELMKEHLPNIYEEYQKAMLLK